MNWKLSHVASAVILSLGLASCGMTSGGGAGMVIANPTVDQMDQYENQWGTKPKTTPTRTAAPGPAPSAGVYVPDGTMSMPMVPAAPATVPIGPAPETPPAPAIPPSLR
jgi:hypothetical protein